MKKIFFVALLMTYCNIVFSQFTVANTVDGDMVFLHDDGTWSVFQKQDPQYYCSNLLYSDKNEDNELIYFNEKEIFISNDGGKTGVKLSIYIFTEHEFVKFIIEPVGAKGCVSINSKVTITTKEIDAIVVMNNSSGKDCLDFHVFPFGNKFRNELFFSTLVNFEISKITIPTTQDEITVHLNSEESKKIMEIFKCGFNICGMSALPD